MSRVARGGLERRLVAGAGAGGEQRDVERGERVPAGAARRDARAAAAGGQPARRRQAGAARRRPHRRARAH